MKPKINHIDGWLYVGIAVAGAVTAAMTTTDAERFIAPNYLFIVKTYAGIFGAACLAAKTYRSTTFADNKSDEKEASANAAISAIPTADKTIEPPKTP